MKPIFRNNPNMPLDVNDETLIVETAIDGTSSEGTVAGMTVDSEVLGAFTAAVGDTFVEVTADAVAGDGIVTIDSTDATGLNCIVIFSNN